MIYKILGKDVYSAVSSGARFVVFSFDGQYALVQSSTEVVDWIEEYSDSALPSLMAESLFKQPCGVC